MSRLYVLDQNYFRSQELEVLAAAPLSKFVILDEALIEMCKAPEWEDTLRRSLRIVAARPARVVVGRSMSELLRWESEHRRSADGRLLTAKGTAFLRDVLTGIRGGADSRGLIVMRANIQETQREMASIHFDHDDNKRGLVELVETAEQSEPQLANAMRKNTLPRAELLRTIKHLGMQLSTSFVERAGFRPPDARRLVRQRSVWLRFGLVRLWYVFDWMSRQGVDGRAAIKATNEKMDYRYIVPATFFNGGLLTKETQMRRCFDDVTELLRRWDSL